MSEKNYYEMLNVNHEDSLAEITKAFNRRLHEINESAPPDKIEQLQAIIEAFAILSDESKRTDYNTYLKTGQALILEGQDPIYKSTSLVERIKFEATGINFEEKIPRLIEKVESIMNGVQDKTVKLKYKGEQVGPEIPMAYAIALEAFGLLGAGMVRTVVANLGVTNSRHSVHINPHGD